MPDDATVVGFVGRFTRDKGIADLIGAFTSTLRERGDVWLLLVGQFEDGDPVPPDVRRTIESDDRIVTVPWLADTGVAYRAMDVLAFPSYREGLPNVPLEAQLCGVPVVAYAATGTVDAVAAGAHEARDGGWRRCWCRSVVSGSWVLRSSAWSTIPMGGRRWVPPGRRG